MSRDPLVEAAGERLEVIYSKAQKLVSHHYKNLHEDPMGYRISIMAYMKMIVDLMKLEKETTPK